MVEERYYFTYSELLEIPRILQLCLLFLARTVLYYFVSPCFCFILLC